MPRQTDRQVLTEEVLVLFTQQLLTEEQESLNNLLYEESNDSDSDDGKDIPAPQLSEVYLEILRELHSSRYLQQRISILKTPQQLWLPLNVYKKDHPELFRSYLWISPATFDILQIPVDQQLAVTLFRFGHYGNAATLQKVGLWAGFGYGTVDLCTKRIMAAICDARFRWAVMQWPTEKQKEDAKAWIESRSCPSWRDGWLMVDGTLVSLFARPGFYGNTWYDRKSNYSLNVQLILNLHIIDYGVGLPGSQHDATAWKQTRIPQEHGTLLKAEEWVWADTAYLLQTWCQAPYKKPEKDTRNNSRYNYYVSRVRVRSEHCVGFLKGRWSSLRGLRLHINNPRHIHLASIWITSCIVLHNFAMQNEEGEDVEGNEFYREGVCTRMVCRNTGKTMVDAALEEIITTLSKMEWLLKSGEAALKPSKRSTPWVLTHKTSTSYHEPLGVVAAIVLWNYPLHNAWSPILAAIFAGNGIIIKCSEHLLACWPEEAPALTQSRYIKHITFIGSEKVGLKVAQAATVHLTAVTLELGGKNPALILPGTDIKKWFPMWMRGVLTALESNASSYMNRNMNS
ncbi:hypothetical protein M422DRAFT_248289 [Sphaerobolus stellatus SS14]|uniref:DDE Tnp4 domain-containing protein n=1 Tax=Sphaerobolus stellatus (strain SS14) TaxID=990650 RepID=A0A0C9UWU0_SPHS4|nr:hypothetical protein M422DRAFT_248289 [Sphaerobolus stellatus SS14]